jgi:hypothetical protein
MTEPKLPQKVVLAEPKCPACKKPLRGINVAGMKLPVPGADGVTIEKFMVYMLPCCPYPDCGVVLAVQWIGEELPQAPGAAAGLWTPPSSH